MDFFRSGDNPSIAATYIVTMPIVMIQVAAMLGLSSDLKMSTVEDESLSVSICQMFCYENAFNYYIDVATGTMTKKADYLL